MRNDALINGALIAAGSITIVDNVVAHWLLGLHRAVPGPAADIVEPVLVALGAIVLLFGAVREARARRAGEVRSPAGQDSSTVRRATMPAASCGMQKYVYSPGTSNVWLHSAPGSMVPESHGSAPSGRAAFAAS